MYECHVTTVYVHPDSMVHEVLADACKIYGFKLAKLYKDNNNLRNLDTFMTAHDESYEVIRRKMIEFSEYLSYLKFTVLRCKIEHIIFDSKYGDIIDD